MKILALVSDAFGGHGGIAQYNRDLLQALAEMPECIEVIAMPRMVVQAVGQIPPKVTYSLAGLRGRFWYVLAVLRFLLVGPRVDLVLCCHINLLPLSWIVSKLRSVPLLMTVFGIDAWHPTRKPLTNWVAEQVDGCIAISRYTRRRFLSWANLPRDRVWTVPNAIHLERFGTSPRSEVLIRRHDLRDRKVIMTFGRLAALERYKGFDEVLEVLPTMLKRESSLVYLIVGDGEDRARLEGKARALGVENEVRFAGRIQENEKAAYYALADAYVMPSHGEGFGFVFLEAMASGLPTVASDADGSSDAVADGQLAAMVDPDDPQGLVEAAFKALAQPRQIPTTLSRFSFANFRSRVQMAVRTLLTGPDRQSPHS
jgi:phosphatidyl-myo-inositol dimannoside synthase